MIPQEMNAGASCANETCPRLAEAGEPYCTECGLERSLYFRERRDPGSDPRVEALRDTARRLFGG